MKKIILTSALAVASASWALAGGLLTNTNQSIHFLRNPARDASTEIDAVYTNPAGLARLEHEGLQFSVNNQSAFQTRTITSTFAPFAGFGGSATKEFKGKTVAPVIPNLLVAYKKGSWVISGSLGVVGGGGSANFDQGLPSFEAQVAMLPIGITQGLGSQIGGLIPGATLSANQYSLSSSMKGSSMILGGQVGGTYSINEMFSGYIGARVNMVNNANTGHLRDIQTNPLSNIPGLGDGKMQNAANYFAALAQIPNLPAAIKADLENQAAGLQDKELDVTQTGWGVTPILGVNFAWQDLNVGIKYEFRTNISLTNDTKQDGTGLFKDGATTPYDLPAMLAIGASYKVLPQLTASVGYHHFFDSNARMANDRQQHIDGGMNEYLGGIEWQINKMWLVSSGVQVGRTAVTDGYQTDLSYSLNSTSLGIGGAVNVTETVRINLGYLWTNYQPWTKEVTNYNKTTLPGTDVFDRTSHSVGVGVDFRF